MNTSVINIRDAPTGWQDDPRYVYIGRACTRGGHALAKSPFANPFRLRRETEREEVLEKYRVYLGCNLELIAMAKETLAGKTLVCWCAPKACHGDVLAELVNEWLGECGFCGEPKDFCCRGAISP